MCSNTVVVTVVSFISMLLAKSFRPGNQTITTLGLLTACNLEKPVCKTSSSWSIFSFQYFPNRVLLLSGNHIVTGPKTLLFKIDLDRLTTKKIRSLGNQLYFSPNVIFGV